MLFLLLALAGCLDYKPATTDVPAPTATSEHWVQTRAADITLGIHAPPGWQAITDERGILLAEHAALDDAAEPRGIFIYIFVPETADMPQVEGENYAWAVLDHITRMPDYVGNAAVSGTHAFTWDHHHAAYYLLSDADGNHTMVLAIALPISKKLIVCNISTSSHDAPRIRGLLPQLLADLTVNGQPMDAAALAQLPDPLRFPPRPASTPEMTDAAAPPAL